MSDNAKSSNANKRPRDSRSSNILERLKISSGGGFAIDQFMLANPQFLARAKDASASELQDAIVDFGGSVFSLSPGEYAVFRDPSDGLMVVFPANSISQEDIESVENIEDLDDLLDIDVITAFDARESAASVGRVFIDTRCVVFADTELLKKNDVLKTFSELRSSGKDKNARDTLRKNGATVRYGFQRFGDELGVFALKEKALVALWPDVVE